MRLCLDNGADPNIKNSRGETVLHYAVRMARSDLVFALVKAGADLSLKNTDPTRPNKIDKTKDLTAYELAKLEVGEYDPANIADYKRHQIEVFSSIKKYEELIQWLVAIGMEQYRGNFIRENWSLEDLPTRIDDAALDHMGIPSAGHRLKIKNAVNALKSKIPAAGQPKLEIVKPPEQTETEAGQAMEMELTRMGIDMKDWVIRDAEVEFTDKIGAGASGKVFKGLYKGKEVAVKVLKATDDELVEEFKKEFKIMSIARSPYLVIFYGAILEPKLCMVMELCVRGSLFNVLQDLSLNIGWSLGLSFLVQATKGLRDLHSKDIFHRDFKSLNLLVDSNYNCKVCDFGLARIDEKQNLETMKKMRGTFAYLAPEVYGGEVYTAAADIYSLGIVIWEVVTRVIRGKYLRPYEEYPHLQFDFQILLQVTKQNLRPTIPATTPPPLVELFKSCVSSNPEERPKIKDILARLLKMQKGATEENAAEWAALLPGSVLVESDEEENRKMRGSRK